MVCFDIVDMTCVLQTKKEQGWQIVGTVGVEEESPEAPPVKCSDFQMLKPTLLLIGKLLPCKHIYVLI